MIDDQRRFIDWLLNLVEKERVDLVAVAGDLYDRSNPSAEAVKLLCETFERLVDVGCEVVAIAGNHDSGRRSGAMGSIAKERITLVGGFDNAGKVITRHIGGQALSIIAVPYLSPQMVPVLDNEPADSTERKHHTHESLLKDALDEARSTLDPQIPSLVLAHAFVASDRKDADERKSDSERTLSVGGTELVSSSVFDGFSYVALGHLHRPQLVAQNETIRYSGTPMPYSFSEGNEKYVVIVDIEAIPQASSEPQIEVSTRQIPVPILREVKTITDSHKNIMENHQPFDGFVRVVLTDEDFIPNVANELRTKFSYLCGFTRQNRDAKKAERTIDVTSPEINDEATITTFLQDATGNSEIAKSDIDYLLAELNAVTKESAA